MATKNVISNGLRFKGAGTATFIKRGPDGNDSKDPNDIYTTGRTVMGAINSTYSLKQEDMPDENSAFSAATYITGITSTVSIVMNTEDPKLNAFLKGSPSTIVATESQWYANMASTIIADADPATEGVVKLKSMDASTPDVKISNDMPVLVRDGFTNDDFSDVGAGPIANSGEFMVDKVKGEFTFHKDDIGKNIYISASLETEDVVVSIDSAFPATQTFKVILSGPAEDYTEIGKSWVTEIYDAMQIQGELNPLTRQQAPSSKTITMQTTKPRGCAAIVRKYSANVIDTAAC